mmetsp:Transcript_31903/g.79558  ORF Transcript_31903/g.79558 Transcript_31903/m.79558 type:complete len:228 (+) Transcript_31903:357-1040(+)
MHDALHYADPCRRGGGHRGVGLRLGRLVVQREQPAHLRHRARRHIRRPPRVRCLHERAVRGGGPRAGGGRKVLAHVLLGPRCALLLPLRRLQHCLARTHWLRHLHRVGGGLLRRLARALHREQRGDGDRDHLPRGGANGAGFFAALRVLHRQGSGVAEGHRHSAGAAPRRWAFFPLGRRGAARFHSLRRRRFEYGARPAAGTAAARAGMGGRRTPATAAPARAGKAG